jgi:hypothetical protein
MLRSRIVSLNALEIYIAVTMRPFPIVCRLCKVRRFLPRRLRDSIRYRIFDNSFIGSTAHFGGGGTVEFQVR